MRNGAKLVASLVGPWMVGAGPRKIMIGSPRSGAVVSSLVQDVELLLEMGDGLGSASACLTVRDLDGNGSPRCSDITITSTEDIVATTTRVQILEGWSTIEASLIIEDAVVSTFAIAVFANTRETVKEGPEIGLAWDLGGGIGWGVLGLHLSLGLKERGVVGIPLKQVHGFDMTPAQRRELEPALKPWTNGPVLHSLGRWGDDGALGSMDEELWSDQRNIGLLFAETEDWSSRDLDALEKFDALLVGSTWSQRSLQEAAMNRSLPPISVFMQGVDQSVFFPSAAVLREETTEFRVFSGGKLEWRKGHDIVIAAFKALKGLLPPTARPILVVSWVNPWPVTVESMANATHTQGVPKADDESGIAEFLKANGVEDAITLPPVSHDQMASVLRSVDVALFPNRVEGGTNLVAMEAAAMGVPTILSKNTGHEDLLEVLGEDGAWVLRNQTGTRRSPRHRGAKESDPHEATEALADVFYHRQEAWTRAFRGAQRMRDWTWARAADVVIEAAT